MNEMDKIMRSKLFAHPSELPMDLWDKIEVELKSKTKRKGFAWPWFAAFGLILIVASTYTMSSVKNVEEEEVSSELGLVDGGNSNDNRSFMEFSLSEENEKIEKNKLTSHIENINYGSSLLPLSKLVSKQSSNSKVDRDLPSNNLNLEKAAWERKNEALQRGEISSTVIVEEAFEGSTFDLKKEQVGRNLEEASVISKTIPLLFHDVKDFPDPLGCPSFSRRYAPNIFVEAFYQPFFAMKQMAPNGAEIGESYIDLRRNTESSLYSWSAGVNIGWISDYDVGVKIGLNFEEINERFMYIDTNAIGSQTTITIDTIFNSDGTFSVTSDTLVQQVTGTEEQNIHNYHRTINLPIHALYQFNFENLALELSGGPEFNISYSNRGKIVNPSNEDQWFTNGRSGGYDVFKTRLDVSFSLSIGLMYSLNEKVQFYARPHLRYHPSSISRTSSPFSQRYLNTGLALGARYYFSGNPNY